MSSGRFPVFEACLTGLASASLATTYLLSPSPSLAPVLAPATLGLSAAWTVWRLWQLDRRIAQWRRWRTNPPWRTTPETLSRPSGVILGKGFRWDATHVELLERALLSDGSLPEGRDARGGLPALHAVGEAAEADVELSWPMLTTHLGVFGTTGSGKSRGLECILSQLIGAP